jgi:glyoxylase-like metal-dependent hydrolase (beta-lactamase superfamily II)
MIEEIATGFFRIEIPLPFGRLKSINSYVIKDSRRHLIIDPGEYNDRCFAVMEEALKRLDVDPAEADFFITHGHGDHLGLVYRLICKGSVVYIGEADARFTHKIKTGVFFSEIRDFLYLSGFPEKDPEKIIPPGAIAEYTTNDPLPYRFVEDMETIERGGYRFTCVETPGHSKGHFCLHESDRKILIAGDHILGEITPAIQARIDSGNPLMDYLSSLDKICTLDVDLVLPGHRGSFRNCTERIEAIKEHHRQRNQEVLSILRGRSRNIYQVASQMTWNTDCDEWDSLPVVQSYFASGEAFSHLKYLEAEGSVQKTMSGYEAFYSLRAD